MKNSSHIVENVVQLPAKSPKCVGKGRSQPLCAAVAADSLTKGFDVGMEEPVGKTHVPGVGKKSRVLSDLSLAKKQGYICCWLSRIRPWIKCYVNSSISFFYLNFEGPPVQARKL